MFLHLYGRVHGGMQFGVLVLVVFWDAVWGAVLVDVLPARDRRDRGRGDGRVSPGALVRCAERGVCPPQNLRLGVRLLGRSSPGARGTQRGGSNPAAG